MPAILHAKTVNVASRASQRQAPLPKAAAQVAPNKKPGKSLLDYLRIALSGWTV
jgi:hypothetical protein